MAPLLYFGKKLCDAGITPVFLLGARSGKDLLLLDEFKKYGRVCVTTEDGSMGEKGFVTNHSVLNEVAFGRIATCGPKPMMAAVARYAKAKGIECEVSLEIRWPADWEHVSAALKRPQKATCVYVRKDRL